MQVPVWLVRCGEWAAATLVALALAVPAARAQVDSAETVTLRVYTDLLQIPTLVLSDARQPVVGLDPKQFRLSVDSGPLFQPPYVRREGDDPLVLTVLLDGNVRGVATEARMVSAVGALVAHALTAHDLLILEAVHTCGATRTDALSVTSAAAIENLMATVLNKRDAAAEQKSCGQPKPLVDMMAEACVQMAQQQRSRRVLLVVSDGSDRGSKTSWRELRPIATARSVAIFAVSVPRQMPRDWQTAPTDSRAPEPENLRALCDLTGGVLISTRGGDLAAAMQGIVHMVRERYILEFPRPQRIETGSHDLQVKVSKLHTVARPAGISFPLVAATELSSPGVVRGEGDRAPEPGTQRVLSGPQPP